MKYFIDTEFLEGPQHKTLLGFNIGLTKPTIDFISIGIVAEDGREYYAVSKDFNLKEAWNRYEVKKHTAFQTDGHELPDTKEYWIRDNVLEPIFKEYCIDCFGCNMPVFTFKSMRTLIERCGKSNSKIAQEVVNFINVESISVTSNILDNESARLIKQGYLNPEFYSYYADYDWVVFCWLFGRMIDLPKGFPMYCNDLKQTLSEKPFENKPEYACSIGQLNLSWKDHYLYPKQTNEHNALADARWNQQLYNFISKI